MRPDTKLLVDICVEEACPPAQVLERRQYDFTWPGSPIVGFNWPFMGSS
jgi:hypothetical protein